MDALSKFLEIKSDGSHLIENFSCLVDVLPHCGRKFYLYWGRGAGGLLIRGVRFSPVTGLAEVRLFSGWETLYRGDRIVSDDGYVVFRSLISCIGVAASRDSIEKYLYRLNNLAN